MMFQPRRGDILIQNNKIIGFLKTKRIDQNLIIFYRAVSIITMDRDQFDLESDESKDDDNESTPLIASSSSTRHSS